MINMKILPCLLIIFISCHCDKEDNIIDTKLSTCMENFLSDKVLSASLKTIRVQNVNGEPHYWLNTDFTQFDGAEYIINKNCDTICSFCGECIPLACSYNYHYEKWQIIWQK